MAKLYELLNNFNIKINLPHKLYDITVSDKMLEGELSIVDEVYTINYKNDDDSVSYVIIDADGLIVNVGFNFMGMSSGDIYSMTGTMSYG